MIIWKDFVLDEVVGMVQAQPEEIEIAKSYCRRETVGWSIKDDANQYQETEHHRRPARMVGHEGNDFVLDHGMEANPSQRTGKRQRGEV